MFSRLADDADRSFPRTVGPDERFDDADARPAGGHHAASACSAAYLRAVTPKPVPRIDLFHVAPIRASVADAVAELVDELPRVGRITFRRLTGGLVERLEVIVRFLAVLELFKQGVVELDQAERFGDIDDRVDRRTASRSPPASIAIDDYEG